ncbi:hypothetical protein [Flavobacterium suzhouense]|uniref:NfeD-like C-terminal domain-containing protein n=1 Tax=Flavobacterium suzhouense TaxID=1529638 RepID=A0ABW5NPA1_9FLAO
MIFPVIIVLAILILARVLMPDLSKLKYSKDLQQKVEIYGVQVGDELDMVLPVNRFEVQVFVKGVINEEGKLAISRDEKLYKKVKKGKILAKVTSISMGGMKIEFFEKVSQA